MRMQGAVANVEWPIVNEQTDQLAVGHVDDRLAGLRVAVATFGVREWPEFAKRVEVCARQSVWLTLVEVAAQPDVTVGECEDRLALRQHVEVQPTFTQAPGFDAVLPDHPVSRPDVPASARHVPASARSGRSAVSPLSSGDKMVISDCGGTGLKARYGPRCCSRIAAAGPRSAQSTQP